ncbi:MAG TPA: DUF4365 domain-containing protein [Longimicrobiaceae bacterium]|nr:DUF4365 domain-containing protein [Longimicrobiaceae bacterium]
MTYTKKRVRQHIMEDRSVRIIQDALPEQWVIRAYKPDYGLDLAIELFEFLDTEKSVAATLGETLFVQVKSKKSVEPARLRVRARRNVELGPLREDTTETVEIEVASLQLETSELMTVQTMGSAIPVMLLLVDLTTQRIYFICLNDLVEKVVLPTDPSYHLKASKVIHLPLRNCIVAGNPASVLPLSLFAKRPKLYAAFEKFSYQAREVELAFESYQGSADEDLQERAADRLMDMVRHFLAIDLRYDFWTRIPEWQAIGAAHRTLLALQEFVRNPAADKDRSAIQEYLLHQSGSWWNELFLRSLELASARQQLYSQIVMIWRGLVNLSGMYEELVRECFLPTYLSSVLTEVLSEASAEE